MAEAKKVVMTYDGLKKMEQELENLKTVRRKEVAEKIKEARGQGDLSENAEYDAAKEEQGEIESRIIQLENLLRNAEVIDEDVLKMDVVNLGSK
jgi:transcription elongation factor GreA